jgi:putative heme degradation protein
MEADELTKMAEEHAHEAHLSPFDRQVAMTMAIMAAALALMTMLSHRAIGESLSLQVEASSLRTEANIYHTRASDQWAYYQAKNIRSTEYQGFLALLDALSARPAAGENRSRQLHEQWGASVHKYEGVELPQLRAAAERLVNQALQYEAEAGAALQRSFEAHARGERLELAELGVELGLVLCSLAVLTKGRNFWYAGIAAGAAGVLVSLTALVL